MIETTVQDFLLDRLGVPVTMEVPEGASGTFVVLEKTGSSRQNYIRRATLAVQSYAPTLLSAAQFLCGAQRGAKNTGCYRAHNSDFFLRAAGCYPQHNLRGVEN